MGQGGGLLLPRHPVPSPKTWDRLHFSSSMSRRWIKHGPTERGKIGWEREGSGWITWGWSPYPPGDTEHPFYIHPMEPKGALYYAIMNQRRALGLDPYTGEPVPQADPYAAKRRLAQRRKSLLAHIRSQRPRIHNAAAYRWVNDYIRRHPD